MFGLLLRCQRNGIQKWTQAALRNDKFGLVVLLLIFQSVHLANDHSNLASTHIFVPVPIVIY